jgi:hypothetical protein
MSVIHPPVSPQAGTEAADVTKPRVPGWLIIAAFVAIGIAAMVIMTLR